MSGLGEVDNTPQKIAIGVGVTLAVLIIIAVVVIILLLLYKRRFAQYTVSLKTVRLTFDHNFRKYRMIFTIISTSRTDSQVV